MLLKFHTQPWDLERYRPHQLDQLVEAADSIVAEGRKALREQKKRG